MCSQLGLGLRWPFNWPKSGRVMPWTYKSSSPNPIATLYLSSSATGSPPLALRETATARDSALGLLARPLKARTPSRDASSGHQAVVPSPLAPMWWRVRRGW